MMYGNCFKYPIEQYMKCKCMTWYEIDPKDLRNYGIVRYGWNTWPCFIISFYDNFSNGWLWSAYDLLSYKLTRCFLVTHFRSLGLVLLRARNRRWSHHTGWNLVVLFFCCWRTFGMYRLLYFVELWVVNFKPCENGLCGRLSGMLEPIATSLRNLNFDKVAIICVMYDGWLVRLRKDSWNWHSLLQ